jgi:3-isopropylmalate/(R)-2-methylmalate dehydratase small subunit
MNNKFEYISAIAAPLRLANVDTDKILAGQYLKTITRTGLGTKLFASMRYDAVGNEQDSFVLNQMPWRNAGILVTLENFGCGSSREHAPWALADFGIRCIIAVSFADIFYSNCFKNGLLPITLQRKEIDILLEDAEAPRTAEIEVDLLSQQVRRFNGGVIHFDISTERKCALLSGKDEISTSLEHNEEIKAWESRRNIISPPIRLDLSNIIAKSTPHALT